MYFKVTEKIFNDLKEYLKEELLLFCVTGSVASGNQVEGWSDLDLVLVSKSLPIDRIENIQKIISLNSQYLKVGITMFTETEFRKKIIDPKSIVSLFLMQKKKYSPLYQHPSLSIPLITQADLVNSGSAMLPETLHLARRLACEHQPDERKMYKTVLLLAKLYIRSQGIVVESSEEINSYFKSHHTTNVELPSPREVASIKSTTNSRRKKYQEFIADIAEALVDASI